MSAPRRRAQRGTTVLEVMMAGVILLIAMVGLVGTMSYAATSTAVGHRRTVTTHLRGELMDRLLVMPRTSASFATLAAAGKFVVDACYDQEGGLLRRNQGYTDTSDGYCDAEPRTLYRSWVSATSNAATSWRVSLFVERTDRGCTASTRYSAVGCSAADLLLTD